MTVKERLADIKAHPERHLHDFPELQACCGVKGKLSMQLLDAHPKRGPKGRCDVLHGPCACGAWH